MSGYPGNLLPVIGSLEGLEVFAMEGNDPGIKHYVSILRSQSVETCQSCEGGLGHSYAEPTIEFYGDYAEGLRALSVAIAYGLPVCALRRAWEMKAGELTGPIWEMIFSIKKQNVAP